MQLSEKHGTERVKELRKQRRRYEMNWKIYMIHLCNIRRKLNTKVL